MQYDYTIYNEKIKQALGGSWPASRWNGKTPYFSDGKAARCDRRTKGTRPAEMGGTDEQYPGSGRRNRFEGISLQLI